MKRRGLGREFNAPWEHAFEKVITPIEEVIHRQTSSGILLMFCAVVALLIANSPVGKDYAEFFKQYLTIGVEGFQLSKSMHHWINDGLMAIFFFLIGPAFHNRNYNFVLPYSAELAHGVLLLLIGSLLVHRFVASGGRPRWAFAVGLCVGGTLLTKPEIALASVALLFGIGVGVWVLGLARGALQERPAIPLDLRCANDASAAAAALEHPVGNVWGGFEGDFVGLEPGAVGHG